MKTSLSLARIKKIDTCGMLEVLCDFPQQCRQAYQIAEGIRLPFAGADIKKIVFAGVGGSAIGAELARSYLYYESKIPISVIREYDTPGYVDETTLVFVSSYSGNTEETLSAYRQAKKAGARIVAMTSGGKLKDSSREDNTVLVEIPQGIPPRCAVGYLSIVPLGLLSKIGIVQDIKPAVNQAAEVLEELLRQSLHPRIGVRDNIAKYIAGKITHKFVVAYSGSIHFDVAAVRFKGQINENAKSFSCYHVLPELGHNEIMGWQYPEKLLAKLALVIFRDKQMHPRINRSIEVIKEMLRKEGVMVSEVWSRGEHLLSRIFSLIYIGDFISYYLAVRCGVDPTPTERITYLKKALAQ